MGEKENGPFHFTFNGLLKVAFQGSHVTSDAGLILVCTRTRATWRAAGWWSGTASPKPAR